MLKKIPIIFLKLDTFYFVNHQSEKQSSMEIRLVLRAFPHCDRVSIGLQITLYVAWICTNFFLRIMFNKILVATNGNRPK